ncbi:hypothetical protein MNBD_BACTEROID03-625 [hydrothermal vent metagenome]|uniref:Uncharacterized protein n=1 Tax=hydrothermal vent metagenome TaxID=652676 RepID=A0A3B0U1J1_9ZZZZ
MRNLIKNKLLVFKRASILLVVLTAYSCGKKDEVVVAPEVAFGKWELTGNSGYFFRENRKNEKYVHINTDNTIDVLSEDPLGFKRVKSKIVTVSDDQITISGSGEGGVVIYNYTLAEDTLILENASGKTIELIRNNNIPEVSDWFEELTILSEGPAPWVEDVDIAYNGTHIVYGNGRESETIGLVNTDNFNLDGEITTTHNAFVVEVEKGDASDRSIFQGNDGRDTFYAYTENTNTFVFKSPELGAWIKGLASIDGENIWVSSGNEQQLYHYNYSNQEIVQTIDLDFKPQGLDYQGGFLYVSDGAKIHKCQTSPTLKPVKSYGIKNHRIYGIAYDGTNFWISAWVNGSYKLIKTDLTL